MVDVDIGTCSLTLPPPSHQCRVAHPLLFNQGRGWCCKEPNEILREDRGG